MQVTNNDKVGKYFFYKINGQVKKLLIPGQTSVELPDLTSTTQLVRNTFDVKVNNINTKLGRNATGDFTVGVSVITPPVNYHLLDAWYASLSVKPTAGLWTDLQALANGMYTDGDWQEIDFFAMLAGMETDEQRLRPLITTSGQDMQNVDLGGGGLVLNVSGATGNGNDYIEPNWNAFTNGAKYTLDSASAGAYMVRTGNLNDSIMGNFKAISEEGAAIQNTISIAMSTLSSRHNSASLNGINGITGDVSKATTVGSAYFATSIRQNATSFVVTLNDVISSVVTSNSIEIVNLSNALLGYVYESWEEAPAAIGSTVHTMRSAFWGSGLVNPTKMGARLNTFFASRGLSIYS